MTLLNKRAQSTGEYAILVTIVLGAVIAVQNAVRNRIAQKILDQATHYHDTAATIDASSHQNAYTSATMTNASSGTAGTQSAGNAATQAPTGQ